jgi:hypothetical protein
MQKIRMNTEYRNKLYNRIKDVFEKEETQERQAFLEARENFNESQKNTFELARRVVERSYPTEDVATLRKFKKKYGDPCDVVAKDKCFYFAHKEDVDEDGDNTETKSHFDFSLFGNLNGNEYGGGDDSSQFAHAYYREELKANGHNPDIIAQQNGKDDNPHKTKVDEAELVRTNSTGLTIYNPSNLASMIKGMKNKNISREDKIKARLQYEKQAVN